MPKHKIQQAIVSRFWSESLKKHIVETGHAFSDEELLALVWDFVPEYQERLRLFGLIAEHIPAISEHARLCIDFMETSLARFKKCDTGAVFELRIADQDAPEERYLCDSYETALGMIDDFWEEYDFSHETPTTEYTIAKRSILRATDAFREDALGRCELGPGKVMLCAEMADSYGWEHTPDCYEIQFPDFIPNLTTVKYRLCGKTEFGLVFEPGRCGPWDTIYVMPLGGQIDPDWWDHDHIFHPDVDTASEDELTEQQKEDAASLRAFLQNWMKEHMD